ncbi:MAG TPA: hypothetical protein VHL09_11950 [Dehalococcoidia bacterium]|nr:hypothetical protein [Dehalococcoidia bacterium]
MVTTATKTGSMTVLKPTAEPKVGRDPLAARPETLSGIKLGLLDNVKVNAGVFLERIEERLREDFEIAQVVRRTKPTASRGMPPEILAAISECNVVVNAFGD